ncbi:MAG TPA: molybdopterin dinucleotide binding domain-containing protein, partial [Candidatus Dormibacteraeota bacterium]|nr:molybdopterin dinucleotide binding domain-containing protein [Candidatus Dormibacteraeota bacterium]
RRPIIIVLDPRCTETAMNASLHVPLAPKSDLILLYAVARALLQRGAINSRFIEAHTTGFGPFAEFLHGGSFTPERACAAAGLSRALFDQLIDLMVSRERVSYWWTMGVNQGHEATRTAQAIINLALMTGNIGRPGTGPNSITGQCNAMGSRLFANITSLLGGRDFNNPVHREFIAGELGLPVERIPMEQSWAYDQIIDGIESGAIRGLWVIATNSAHSWIGQRRLQALLDKLDFLVVQDLYFTTDTARRAHLLLPAAGWGEKDGTLINSERRLGLVKKVRRAPGEALADFHIFKLIAAAWGCADAFRQWDSPHAVFQILKRLSAGQPSDISGIRDFQHLDEAGGIQWPFPMRSGECGARNEPSSACSSALCLPHSPIQSGRRLFEDGRFFTKDGRARFVFEKPQPVAEPVCPEFPFVLLTGRGSSAQWHTNTRTAKSAILRKLHPANCYVEIHPDDARRLRIGAGATVHITSRRGTLEAAALLTRAVQRGQIFVPMHYEGVNQLTCPSYDPYSRQPSYKHCAVRVALASDRS